MLPFLGKTNPVSQKFSTKKEIDARLHQILGVKSIE